MYEEQERLDVKKHFCSLFKTYKKKIIISLACVTVIPLLLIFAVPPVIGAVGRRIEHRNRLVYTHFLEDLDYMLYVLENNFCLLNVAYWAHGVDIHELFERTRHNIYANQEMSAEEFHILLARNLNPAFSIGHFRIIGPVEYFEIMDELEDVANWRWLWDPETSVARLFYPRVRKHYEAMNLIFNGYNEHSIDGSYGWWTMVSYENRMRRLVDLIMLYNETELAEALAKVIEEGNKTDISYLRQEALDIINNTPNVSTSVLEEGRIAYLSINSFMTSEYETEYQTEQILSFYEDIQGFEHLIIDLRRNGGGHVSYFYEAILSPNIPDNIVMNLFVFMQFGDYNTEFKHHITQWWVSSNLLNYMYPAGARLRPSSLILRYNDIPEINLQDMERMEYGFRTNKLIRPARLERFDFEPAFDGKIWLLTHPLMGSATEISARIAKNSGFATLVGERTSGCFGGMRIFIALPNTGILFQMDLFYVTDQYGRPLEAGTYPHHFNKEGLCALETVLWLIGEGKY